MGRPRTTVSRGARSIVLSVVTVGTIATVMAAPALADSSARHDRRVNAKSRDELRSHVGAHHEPQVLGGKERRASSGRRGHSDGEGVERRARSTTEGHLVAHHHQGTTVPMGDTDHDRTHGKPVCGGGDHDADNQCGGIPQEKHPHKSCPTTTPRPSKPAATPPPSKARTAMTGEQAEGPSPAGEVAGENVSIGTPGLYNPPRLVAAPVAAPVLPHTGWSLTGAPLVAASLVVVGSALVSLERLSRGRSSRSSPLAGQR
jgi:hypothetical protein